MFAYRPVRAYPLLSFSFRCLIFLLIWVIYWHFLDAILGHTPSPFELFTPKVHWRLSGIVFGSLYLFGDSPTSCSDPLSFSVALRHRARILYLFGGSPTSCLDPLSFRWLFNIVFRSPILSMDLWNRVRILFLFDSSPTSCSNPYIFDSSPASCPDPLYFQRLSGIMSRSLIISTAL